MPRVWLEAPDAVPHGSHVDFRLVVLNEAASAVELYLHGREPTLDVIVANERGESVWRRLEGLMVPAALLLRTLAPGERLELSATWNLRAGGAAVPAGVYEIRASLLAEGRSLEAPPRQLSVIGSDSAPTN